MDWPNTKKELKEWFCGGPNPTHTWEKLEPLVDNLWKLDREMGIVDEGYSAIANEIFDNQYLYTAGRYGWVTHEGEFITCGYAHHDHLLEALGIDIKTIESDHNWIRISFTLCAMDPPNEAQSRILNQLVDDGILLKAQLVKYIENGWSI